ncbi:hypothetical protein MRX96_019823 [Rhipicephalus microplus]
MSDVCPISIRSTGVCLAYSCRRVGAALGVLAAKKLAEAHSLALNVPTTLMVVVSAGAIQWLPDVLIKCSPEKQLKPDAVSVEQRKEVLKKSTKSPARAKKSHRRRSPQRSKARTKCTKAYRIENWLKFREMYAAVPVTDGFLHHILECASAATTVCRVPAGTPATIIKLLNLRAAQHFVQRAVTTLTSPLFRVLSTTFGAPSTSPNHIWDVLPHSPVVFELTKRYVTKLLSRTASLVRLAGEESATVDMWKRQWVLCATVTLMALIIFALAVVLYSPGSTAKMATNKATVEDSIHWRVAAETVAAATGDEDRETDIRRSVSLRERVHSSEGGRADTTSSEKQDSNETAVAEKENEEQPESVNVMGSAYEWG